MDRSYSSRATVGKAIGQIFRDIARGIEQRGAVGGCPLNNLAMELSAVEPGFRDALGSIFEEWQAALEERFSRTRGGARLDRARLAAGYFRCGIVLRRDEPREGYAECGATPQYVRYAGEVAR